MGNSIKYKKIVESLKLLALPYEEQKKCFPDFVDTPFEVLDTYHNAFIIIPPLIGNEIKNYEVIANLMRIHNFVISLLNSQEFDEMPEEAFTTNANWNKIRNFSIEVLKLMDEPVENPDLHYI